MRWILIFMASFQFSYAMAGQNLNHISCVYFHDAQGWHHWMNTSSGSNYDLKSGERYFLAGFWTSEKPVLPNYAVCTAMVGTEDDNSVAVEGYRYKADAFDPIQPDGSCSVTGQAVELMSKDITLIQRGSFAEVEVDWLPPHQGRIRVREYLPLISEMDKIKEISTDKCVELTPTEN